MKKFRIKFVTFKGAEERFYENGKKMISELLPAYIDSIEFVDNEPDLLFFLSGGSEQAAIDCVENNKFYTLLAYNVENSFAAAMEVKAWLNNNNINSILLNYNDIATKVQLEKIITTKLALNKLHGKQLGLVGEVSEWLVASSVDSQILASKLGILLKQIAWATLPSVEDMGIDENFMKKFSEYETAEIENAAKVYSLLRNCIDNQQLDAITVECFPMVRQKAITACLALSHFNDQKIPAGCEGDLVSIAGIMLAQQLFGEIPWMANVANISKNTCLLAHCTVATSFLSNFSITTHFETGKGTAIKGEILASTITVFRFNNALTKAFVAKANHVISTNFVTACRTQIVAEMSLEDINVLQNKSLGNHVLILKGDFIEQLKIACQLLCIEIIN